MSYKNVSAVARSWLSLHQFYPGIQHHSPNLILSRCRYFRDMFSSWAFLVYYLLKACGFFKKFPVQFLLSSTHVHSAPLLVCIEHTLTSFRELNYNVPLSTLIIFFPEPSSFLRALLLTSSTTRCFDFS